MEWTPLHSIYIVGLEGHPSIVSLKENTDVLASLSFYLKGAGNGMGWPPLHVL